MALKIKAIPVLRDKEARSFDRKASKKAGQKHSVNFTKQFLIGTLILSKAKI
jgi:hypothetical protein